jgi:hypothetical protein
MVYAPRGHGKERWPQAEDVDFLVRVCTRK